jgi:predicted ester cyclase
MKYIAALALVLASFTARADGPSPTRKTLDRFFAAVDAKDVKKLPDVETADVAHKTPQASFTGVAGHQQMLQGFGGALPNFKHVIERCVEQGATIACEGRFLGDHTGPMFMPNGGQIPASGKRVDFPFTVFATVRDGKISSCHIAFDPTVMMRQIGAM